MRWSDFSKKGKTKKFTIDYFSPVYEEELKGTFICRKQRIKDGIQIELLKSELTEGKSHDEFTSKGISRESEFFCLAVATCKVALLTVPEWFSLEDLEECEDFDLVMIVAQEVFDFEGSFRGSPNRAGAAELHTKPIEESDESDGSESDSSEAQHQEQPPDNTDKEMVGEQIPSISKIG